MNKQVLFRRQLPCTYNKTIRIYNKNNKKYKCYTYHPPSIPEEQITPASSKLTHITNYKDKIAYNHNSFQHPPSILSWKKLTNLNFSERFLCCSFGRPFVKMYAICCWESTNSVLITPLEHFSLTT